MNVVRELSDENQEGATDVVRNMESLISNNEVLNERTQSSILATDKISEQVEKCSRSHQRNGTAYGSSPWKMQKPVPDSCQK